jgi:hypothetical protein
MKKCGAVLIGMMILFIFGCVSSRVPPLKSQPVDAFEMVYTPTDSQTYPPTSSDPYPPFKMTWALPGKPVKVNKDEKITRPYNVIGKMVFKSNWYDDETIAKLIRLYVPQKGGDAVSSYHMEQERVAVMKNPETGKFRTCYFGTINLEIIRYTDKQGQ